MPESEKDEVIKMLGEALFPNVIRDVYIDELDRVVISVSDGTTIGWMGNGEEELAQVKREIPTMVGARVLRFSDDNGEVVIAYANLSYSPPICKEIRFEYQAKGNSPEELAGK